MKKSILPCITLCSIFGAVAQPLTIELDFENQVHNSGDPNVVFEWHGDPVYRAHTDNIAAEFSTNENATGSYVKTGRISELLTGSNGLHLQFDMQLSDNARGTMRPIWLHQAYGIQLRGDTLSFVFNTTDDGLIWDASAKVPEVFDGNWHQIYAQYETATGTAKLMVNGETVSEVTGLSGAIPTIHGRRLTIGSDGWSKHFSGWIDSFSIELLQDSVASGFQCDLSTYDYCIDNTLAVEVQPIARNGNGENHQAALFNWQFNSSGKPVKIGQFANGDYWIAPATGEQAITLESISGSSSISADINPVVEQMGLLDGSKNYGNYDPSENIVARLPLTISEPASIVAAIQRDESATSPCGTKRIVGECVDAYQVVTFLPHPPVDFGKNTLRPSVTHVGAPMMSMGDFDLESFPSLSVFEGANAEELETIRRRWSHTLNIFSALNEQGKGYSEGGRAFRSHILVDDYASGMARQYYSDLFTLMSDANSLEEKKSALAAMLTFGLDMYYTIHGEGVTNRYYGSGAGQSTGKFFPPVLVAALVKNEEMRKVVSNLSVTANPHIALRPQEIEQINLGPNGPVWGDLADEITSLQLGAYWGSLLKSQCFDGATGECDANIGKKTSRDPYLLIDGPPNKPGSSYQPVTLGPYRAIAAVMQLVPRVCETVNYPAIVEYVNRLENHGVQTKNDICAPPDPRENPDTCDAYRQKNCEYYGLSNTGEATWGPDPENPQQCITNATHQNGRFPHRDGESIRALFSVSQVERNWDWIKANAVACR